MSYLRLDDAPGLNESPSEKEGKSARPALSAKTMAGLNESPSEKEGKFQTGSGLNLSLHLASMKAPPKRKGNRSKIAHLPNIEQPQ